MARNLTINQMLTAAQKSPDEWVVRIVYRDVDGTTTKRTISPIRVVGRLYVQALCFAREDVRNFRIPQILSAKLRPAWDAIMPEPLEVITEEEAAAL